MTRAVNMLACLVVVLAIIVAMRGWLFDHEGATQNPAASVSAEFLMAVGSGPRLGPSDAPVILLLYSDYRCAACRDFDKKLRSVRMRYPEHLAVVVKPFFLLDTSEDTKLFLAAECAHEQGRFDAFHTTAIDMFGSNDAIRHWTAVADSVSVSDREQFDRCVLGAKYAERIQRHYIEAVSLGVRVIPTSIINGMVYEGSLGLAALDSAVARAMPRHVR